MTSIFTAECFYALVGAIFALVAGRIVLDRTHRRRWGSALFWAVLAVIYLFGKALPPLAVGYLILVLIALAGFRQVERSEEKSTTRDERLASAARLENRLFRPALLVPAAAVAGSLLLGRIAGDGWSLFDPKQLTLISLGLGALAGLAYAQRLTRERPAAIGGEASRLLQALGWALLLPQLLAALGGIFGASGVGEVVAALVKQVLPVEIRFVAVVAYGLGMAVFTICLGNAFAAWPVMMLGIGLPILVQQHHANLAILAALGMLCGYCGTLLTPMAANFNLVPAILLELRDRHAVIRAQAPLAAVILVANILLMEFLVFRF